MSNTSVFMEHPPKPLVFISYSHRDQRWVDQLLMHLKPLKDRKLLDCWSDHEIIAGRDWRGMIDTALREAEVAVLLVSPAFLASDFIAKNELPALLTKCSTILWIPISATVVGHTEIARYQAACDPAHPLDSLPKPTRNKVLVSLCEKIVAATVVANNGA